MEAHESQITRLEAMPSVAEFYGTYWNKRPFVVRGAISPDVFAGLITGDELAGLAMEDAPQSRMVLTVGAHHEWRCRFGPFNEQDFHDAGDVDWTLLVQNVEQFHPQTGALLRHFDFTPRWLMDDIMVSYSAPGGSVGPHIDNYHVFLVQGEGRRRWKVGHEPIQNERYIAGLDFKILENTFAGDEVELGLGDILYLPPRFGHEGTTLERALTFSVGFLGPKQSALFSSYGQYLSECEDLDRRYVGGGLMAASAGFVIDTAAVNDVRNQLASQLKAKDFAQWLVEFFTESSHEDFGTYATREDPLDLAEFQRALQDGLHLIKPEYVKFAITAAAGGQLYLGFDAHSFTFDESLFPVISKFMKEDAVGLQNAPQLADDGPALSFVHELYNQQALEFEP